MAKDNKGIPKPSANAKPANPTEDRIAEHFKNLAPDFVAGLVREVQDEMKQQQGK